ncbi:probable blue pigment (indigoidine) exporter [Roseibium suaedae]|uniref:Probable blue pigment (Indigoidine) exporter n=2 Tax=Roseibium suaedae TaxID=735517 RepID=A0A1M7MKD1_9HYPH|nr:probable blue pigment (indigoidine) exporter [Roseibium suaedae]
MSRTSLLLMTAAAPAIWGSSYIVATSFLPGADPIMVSLLRALPPGLLLLALTRQVPRGAWIWKVLLLGALNFSFFWSFLFLSAYRLPGGVAATVGAIQPLIVVILARLVLGAALKPLSVGAAILGMGGVGLLVLGPSASLDPVGIAAGLAGAVSMALGSVLTRKWQPPVSPLTFTAWQLTAGGLLLVPIAFGTGASLPPLSMDTAIGIGYLGLIGAALTYIFWFRGIAKLGPQTVAPLGFLSPVTAVLLGWIILGQALTPTQMAGAAIVLISVWLGQRAQRPQAPGTQGRTAAA